MYLRDTDFPTLVDVYQGLDDHRRTWGGSSTAIDVQITEVEALGAPVVLEPQRHAGGLTLEHERLELFGWQRGRVQVALLPHAPEGDQRVGVGTRLDPL